MYSYSQKKNRYLVHQDSRVTHLFSLDNFQMCFGQINQKDDFLFISAPFPVLETGTLATQIHVGRRTQAELQNILVSIVSTVFSFFSMNFHAACKEQAFHSDLKVPTIGPQPIFTASSFPTTFLHLQHIGLTPGRVSAALNFYCSSEYPLSPVINPILQETSTSSPNFIDLPHPELDPYLKALTVNLPG